MSVGRAVKEAMMRSRVVISQDGENWTEVGWCDGFEIQADPIDEIDDGLLTTWTAGPQTATIRIRLQDLSREFVDLAAGYLRDRHPPVRDPIGAPPRAPLTEQLESVDVRRRISEGLREAAERPVRPLSDEPSTDAHRCRADELRKGRMLSSPA